MAAKLKKRAKREPEGVTLTARDAARLVVLLEVLARHLEAPPPQPPPVVSDDIDISYGDGPWGARRHRI